jgi:hypothetical protein
MEQVYERLVAVYNGEGWLSQDGTLLTASIAETTPFADSGYCSPELAEVHLFEVAALARTDVLRFVSSSVSAPRPRSLLVQFATQYSSRTALSTVQNSSVYVRCPTAEALVILLYSKLLHKRCLLIVHDC